MTTLETFESRLCLSTTAQIDPPIDPLPPGGTARLTATGSLYVNGTAGADAVTLERNHNAVTVKFGDTTSHLFIGAGEIAPTIKTFDARLIKRIIVDAGAGNDSIQDNIQGQFVPSSLGGGSGNDFISAEGRHVTLLGGAGDDKLSSVQFSTIQISGGTTSNDNTGTVVSFNHELFSYFKASANRLDGGTGDDTFQTAGGDDTIVGGSGNDHYTAYGPGLDVFDHDLAPQSVASDGATVRSRLVAIGVEDVTTHVKGNTTLVTLGPSIIVHQGA